MAWNVKEYIEDMVAAGYDHGLAIEMAKLEGQRRKRKQRREEPKITNDRRLGTIPERKPINLHNRGTYAC